MVKYLIMDVDGTLTDGKIYMGPDGEAIKAFSVKDGYTINHILKPMEIIPIIITARKSSIVQHRCDELGIKEVHQGKMDKLTVLKEIVGKENMGSCAYFGDDLLDLNCMLPIKEAGGVIGCPSDAVQEIRAVADYICINKAGEGALREFAEWMVKPIISEDEIEKRIKNAISYLQSLCVTEDEAGKNQIVDENFSYTIQSYMTKSDAECKLESHRSYVDIQIMVSGNELMNLADISRLTVKEEYDADKDVMYWNVPRRMIQTKLRANDCIVLYPENAHRGAISIKESEHVLKIVGKVKIV